MGRKPFVQAEAALLMFTVAQPRERCYRFHCQLLPDICGCRLLRVDRIGLWHHQWTMQGDDKPGWIQPTDEAVIRASQALIALVPARLPQRFYREHPWRTAGADMA
jgi:hypothetical protein